MASRKKKDKIMIGLIIVKKAENIRERIFLWNSKCMKNYLQGKIRCKDKLLN